MTFVHPDLGRIVVPAALRRAISLPNRPIRRVEDGEFGLFVAVVKRRVIDEWTGKTLRYQLIDYAIGHNSRQNIGAAGQAYDVFGTAGTTPNGKYTVIALASAALTVSATGADLSLGSNSANVTTNEYTGFGLARAAGTVGTYTAPTADGGQFTQAITHTFTNTDAAAHTVYGGGLVDTTSTASFNLYAEGNFGTSATLQPNDQLAFTASPSN